MLKRLLFALALFCGTAAGALAQTTILPGAYTDLGAGPGQVANTSNVDLSICVSSVQPTPPLVCSVLTAGGAPIPFSTTAHLWAMPMQKFAASAVVSPIAGGSVSLTGPLPLPAGAATAANQPALNADGGAAAHVTNFPATQPISATALPLPNGAATAANQPALNADGGAAAHVTNFPTTQPISATALPLPNGAATDSNLSALITALTNAINGGALVPPFPVQVAGSHVVTDVASAAVTANGASAIITDIGQSNASVVNVTAASTSSTLDIVEWESNDGGVNDWHPVYALPRITTAGVYLVPNHAIAGVRKWVYTLGGTSPSFNFSILSSRGHVAAPVLRSFWDRTIVPNTAGSTTASFFVGGAKYFVANVNMASGGTAGTMQWQFSNDNQNWNYVGSAFTATTNTVTVNYPTVPVPMAYVRLYVATAGTSTTLNSVNISASN